MTSTQYRHQIVLDAETDAIRRESANFSRTVREGLRLMRYARQVATETDNPGLRVALLGLIVQAKEN